MNRKLTKAISIFMSAAIATSCTALCSFAIDKDVDYKINSTYANVDWSPISSTKQTCTVTRRVRTAHQQRKRLSKSTMTTILIFLQSPTMAQRTTAGMIPQRTRLLRLQ